ncbi:unnamed protein product [Euphydryas editha]|uniref:FLYWCH-type domain-containing protein n=1 Tax=Euphydryas editha TaxID=104508 RepID=A0AAU9THW0_EUPED|nr:unnamed protein product [Euphydryas editha]
MRFVMTHFGNRALLLNGKRYNKKRQTSNKTTWQCVRRREGCKGYVFTINDQVAYVYYDVTKVGGRVLVINGERYNKQSANGARVYWRCIKRNIGCKSSIWTVYDEIIKIKNSHNH